ncbi:MAG: PorT family protein, partial [Bacteroidales bacterium]|nr:PorT family protein [Bacteroidales bacterium]
ILQKEIPRVHFGVKFGAQYGIVTDYKLVDDTYEKGYMDVMTKPAIGFNGGAYMDLNLSRTFAFEFGLQWYLKKFEFDDYWGEVNLNTLHISIVTCKWRPGDGKKQFFLLLGHGVELTLQKEVKIDDYGIQYKSHDVLTIQQMLRMLGITVLDTNCVAAWALCFRARLIFLLEMRRQPLVTWVSHCHTDLANVNLNIPHLSASNLVAGR